MDASIYQRPNKPMVLETIPRKRFECIENKLAANSILEVAGSTECHVTPDQVAMEMVEIAYELSNGGATWFEPQCGTGQLINAMLKSGVANSCIVGVERQLQLVDYCRDRFNDDIHVVAGCFLDWGRKNNVEFDHIVCNPPFKMVYQHVKSALNCLSEGGVIVALVPVTFDLAGFTTVKVLENDTFPNAKVTTKIVTYVA